MQKDLQEIKELLKNAARAPRIPAALPSTLDTSGVLIKGDTKAPVTIVEFTDMQCPFCSRYAQNTFAQIDNEYIKTGKVRYVVKNFPLESMHPNAFKAAEATHCAAEQDRAWDMHNRLFANQQKLAADDLDGYAGALGLDSVKFKGCLESGRYAAAIRKEISEGQLSGVTGTPTFFLGTAGGQPNQMKPDRMLSGAQAYSAFKAAIDDLLAKPVAGAL
jgi:protein-disulfide isomerase